MTLLTFDIITATQILHEIKFGKFKRSKNAIFCNFGGSEFWFDFELFFTYQIYQNSKFWVSKIVKKAIFEIHILPKLISRKVGSNQILEFSVGLNFTFWNFPEHSVRVIPNSKSEVQPKVTIYLKLFLLNLNRKVHQISSSSTHKVLLELPIVLI